MKKKLLAGAIAATMVLGASTASGGTIQLGFILDRSGSIGTSDWNTIVDGLSLAVQNVIPIPNGTTFPDTYEITVVSFATTASIDINSFAVTDAASRDQLATDIFNLGDGRSNDVFVNGGSGVYTNFEAAFSAMNYALNDATGVTVSDAVYSYVNFATDGVPNRVGAYNPSGAQSATTASTAAATAAGKAARDALLGTGVDNISIEGIGGGVNKTSLMTNFCSPQPCDETDPYNFPDQGFYIGVNTAADYADAIENKIRVVTGQADIPAPAPIALLGIGLIGGLMMRRKRATA